MMKISFDSQDLGRFFSVGQVNRARSVTTIINWRQSSEGVKERVRAPRLPSARRLIAEEDLNREFPQLFSVFSWSEGSWVETVWMIKQR